MGGLTKPADPLRPGHAAPGPGRASTWLLVAAWSAGVSAIVGLIGDSYHLYWAFLADAERSELLGSPLYRAHGVLIAAAYGLALLFLPGFTMRLAPAIRQPVWVGLVLSFLGTTFVAGDYWAESVVTPGVVAAQPTLADASAGGLHLAFVVAGFGLHAIGWLLIAIGSWRSGAPKRLCTFLGLAAVVSFTPLPGSNMFFFASMGAFALWLGASRQHA